MSRKGQTAVTLFCALSIGGIMTLFSQADAFKEQSTRFRSMNVSSPESNVFKRTVPTAIESGAVLKEQPGENGKSAKKRKTRTRLRLR